MIREDSEQIKTQPSQQANGYGILICLLLPFELTYLFLFSCYIIIRNVVRYFIPGQLKGLKNEIILVTGGANGIGREICLRLANAERNVTIISWDLNEKENLITLELLKALGVQRPHAMTVDVSNQKEVEAAAQKIRKDIGDVTIVFNNAGYGGDFNYGWKQKPELIQKTFDVNVVSHYWTLREFLPKMIETGRGHFVETCSVLGFMFLDGSSAYSGSKFAIRGVFHSIKEELRRLPGKPDIQISLVYPSYVSTNMFSSLDIFLKRYTFMNQITSPGDAAKIIVDGMRQNKEHIYIPELFRIIHLFMGFMPDEVYAKFLELSGSPGMVRKTDEKCI